VIFTSYKTRAFEHKEKSIILHSNNSTNTVSSSSCLNAIIDHEEEIENVLPPLSLLFLQLDFIGSLLIQALVSTRHIGIFSTLFFWEIL
jgi:hypothetical protein